MNEFGERDSKDENRLTIYLNEETYQALFDLGKCLSNVIDSCKTVYLDETSTNTPTELISIAENLFSVLPKDNRSPIEKLSDLFGIENGIRLRITTSDKQIFSLRCNGCDSYNELVCIIQDNWTEPNVFNGNWWLAKNHIILCLFRIVLTRSQLNSES